MDATTAVIRRPAKEQCSLLMQCAVREVLVGAHLDGPTTLSQAIGESCGADNCHFLLLFFSTSIRGADRIAFLGRRRAGRRRDHRPGLGDPLFAISRRWMPLDSVLGRGRVPATPSGTPGERWAHSKRENPLVRIRRHTGNRTNRQERR